MSRKTIRELAIERDEGCLVAPMMMRASIVPHCYCPMGIEVHELKSRGRGGPADVLENVICLCRLAHQWVTENPWAAETLGLLLPGWTDNDPEEGKKMRLWAAGRREGSITTEVFTVPPWWHNHPDGKAMCDATRLALPKLIEVHSAQRVD